METPRRPSAGPLVLVALAAALALGWRAAGADEWPTFFHPCLQYESALAARTVWLAVAPHERTPDRAGWADATGTRHVVSPPLLPGLVAGCSALAGHEVPWVAKLFNAAFWLAAGGCVLAAVVRQTGSRWAAAVAFAWFALTPFGVRVSRSFQPESLLALGLAAAVCHLSRPGRSLAWRATLAAGAVCGAAAFVKPGVLFLPLLAGFAALLLPWSVPGSPARKALHFAAFAALTVLPSLLYAAAVLRGHVGNKVIPALLAEGWFYPALLESVRAAVGYPALLAGLFGAWVAARAGNLLPAGLFAGYLGYVGVFTFHCATHDYYHVPLLVLAAVGLGWAVAWVERRVRVAPRSGVAFALIVLGLAAYLCATRDPHLGPWRWTPAGRREAERLDEKRERAREIGRVVRELVRPGARVLAVTENYGYPLEYDGWVPVCFWPTRADAPIMVRAGVLPSPFTADGYLAHLIAERACELAVVTDFAEYDGQPELRAALARRGRLVRSSPGLLVFDLRAGR